MGKKFYETYEEYSESSYKYAAFMLELCQTELVQNKRKDITDQDLLRLLEVNKIIVDNQDNFYKVAKKVQENNDTLSAFDKSEMSFDTSKFDKKDKFLKSLAIVIISTSILLTVALYLLSVVKLLSLVPIILMIISLLVIRKKMHNNKFDKDKGLSIFSRKLAQMDRDFQNKYLELKVTKEIYDEFVKVTLQPMFNELSNYEELTKYFFNQSKIKKIFELTNDFKANTLEEALKIIEIE